MKTVSEFHFDTLSKIISLGTNCAVKGLSEMLGESVQSSTPNVNVVTFENANLKTLNLNVETFGVVLQEFTGVLNAEVMMLFPEENALRIVQNMMGIDTPIEVVRESESEAMCELGNIMINGCLSSIADALHIPLESSLPRYVITSKNDLLEQIKNIQNQDIMLISHVDLSISELPAEVKLVFLMNAKSINNVTNEIEKFAAIV